jgi:uncharacterized protein (TIGR02246 family)
MEVPSPDAIRAAYTEVHFHLDSGGRTPLIPANTLLFRKGSSEIPIMKSRLILLLTVNLTLAAIAFAAQPGATPSSQPASSPQVANSSLSGIQVITQLDKDYEAAYNRGDANAVAALYTDDAEYVDEGGNVVIGRDTIELLLAEEFASNPGGKLQIIPEGVRVLTPDVLVEKGWTAIAPTGGSQRSSRYVAVYLKRSGNWKIGQLTLTTTL